MSTQVLIILTGDKWTSRSHGRCLPSWKCTCCFARWVLVRSLIETKGCVCTFGLRIYIKACSVCVSVCLSPQSHSFVSSLVLPSPISLLNSVFALIIACVCSYNCVCSRRLAGSGYALFLSLMIVGALSCLGLTVLTHLISTGFLKVTNTGYSLSSIRFTPTHTHSPRLTTPTVSLLLRAHTSSPSRLSSRFIFFAPFL